MGKEICPKFATLAQVADVNNLTLHHMLNCLPLLNMQPASLHDWLPSSFSVAMIFAPIVHPPRFPVTLRSHSQIFSMSRNHLGELDEQI